jgi:Methyltransferase domain
MRAEPAGDFDYDKAKIDYASIRQSEPTFAAAIEAALGSAESLINVGAGTGSYEPLDRQVTAVEPSAAQRSQRPAHLTPAIDAVAEDLPFPDDAFDAALATVTVHQWRDLATGLSEMRRVTRGPVIVMTFAPERLREFWMAEYAPEFNQAGSSRMPRIEQLTELLGGAVVEELPVPAGCVDGFDEAFFGRPEAFLDERVRRAQSSWGFVGPDVEHRSVARLRDALDNGSWDECHGHLRTADHYQGSVRLIVASGS